MLWLTPFAAWQAAARAASLFLISLVLSSCASPPAPADIPDAQFTAWLQTQFRSEGQAQLDRLQQAEEQRLCSSPYSPESRLARQLEAQALTTVRPPSDGRYLGDWREGGEIAQSGRGLTWSDAVDAPRGGGCYNCHQIAPQEIAHGTLGPSLKAYGRLRGINDPNAASARPVLEYTWAKLYNAWSFQACSRMPRFGHHQLLTENQLRDVMALLLDPASPVNTP